MNYQILTIGIISSIVFSVLLEYIGIGDFTRSALIGSTLIYLFWLFFLSGIITRLIFLFYLRHHKMKRALALGIIDLFVWILVTGYLFSALYFQTAYEMSIHFKFHYAAEAILFVFAVMLLFEKTADLLLNGIAWCFLIFSFTVGLEFITETKVGEFLFFLAPIPTLLMTLLFIKERQKSSDQQREQTEHILDN